MRVVVKALMVSPVHWPPFKTPEAGTLLEPQRQRPEHRDTGTERKEERNQPERASSPITNRCIWEIP
jgi:hypothetical protein